MGERERQVAIALCQRECYLYETDIRVVPCVLPYDA